MSIVLAAEEAAGKQTLQLLAELGEAPRLVLTAAPPLARLAESLGCAVAPPRLVKDPGFAGCLRALDCTLFLNVHSLHIVCPEVARAPRLGAFNLHPGPLPEYAGLNTPSWGLLNGESAFGVTLHWIDPGVDTGAIAYQARFPLRPDDTGLRVALRCAEHGVPLIRRLLEAAPDIPAMPQDQSRRRYFRRGAPDGGRLDWGQPAERLERLARAYDYTPFPSPWGRLTATLEGRPFAIRRLAPTGHAAAAPPGTLWRDGAAVLVAAADQWVRLLGAPCEPVPAMQRMT